MLNKRGYLIFTLSTNFNRLLLRPQCYEYSFYLRIIIVVNVLMVKNQVDDDKKLHFSSEVLMQYFLYYDWFIDVKNHVHFVLLIWNTPDNHKPSMTIIIGIHFFVAQWLVRKRLVTNANNAIVAFVFISWYVLITK